MNGRIPIEYIVAIWQQKERDAMRWDKGLFYYLTFYKQIMLQIKKFMPTTHKIKALIYWPSGSGKTSFGWTAQNVIFASAENGLLSIAEKWVDYVEIKQLEDLTQLRDFLKKWDHKYETLVIDSITEISDIIKNGIEKKTGRKMQIQDWWDLASAIEKIIKDIKEIDINVLVIAQELQIQDENKISQIVPSLNGKSSTKICYYMDIVGYIFVDKNGKRTIITNSSDKFLTKDRTGKIGNDQELDFERWKDLVKSIAIWTEEVVENVQDENEQKQTQLYEEYTQKLKKCKNEDLLKGVFTEIHRNKSMFTESQYNDLSALKDDMKVSLKKKVGVTQATPQKAQK